MSYDIQNYPLTSMFMGTQVLVYKKCVHVHMHTHRESDMKKQGSLNRMLINYTNSIELILEIKGHSPK